MLAAGHAFAGVSAAASASQSLPISHQKDRFRMMTNAQTEVATGKYLTLTTYRRNGQPVPTPVWFVEADGVIYLRTFANMAKVKRLRNNPRVQIAACDASGVVSGPEYSGVARLLDGSEADAANQLLNRKYGLIKRLSDIWYVWRSGAIQVIAVHPDRSASTGLPRPIGLAQDSAPAI